MYEKFLEEVGNFIFMEDQPELADIIFVPGNSYPYMAEKAAELYRLGLAPMVLPSGRYSISSGKFSGVTGETEKYNEDYQTEWEFLKDVLMKNGVPESAVLREDEATFMAECTFFEKSDRSGRVESEKGNFVLQELSCKESIYVLSEGVSGNRISGMPLLCG